MITLQAVPGSAGTVDLKATLLGVPQRVELGSTSGPEHDRLRPIVEDIVDRPNQRSQRRCHDDDAPDVLGPQQLQALAARELDEPPASAPFDAGSTSAISFIATLLQLVAISVSDFACSCVARACGTASTGQGDTCSKRWVTLPKTAPTNAERPRVPTMIRSTSLSDAIRDTQ